MRRPGPDQAELFFFIVRVAPTAPNKHRPSHRHKKFPIACCRPLREARVGHAEECKDQHNTVWQFPSQMLAPDIRFQLRPE